MQAESIFADSSEMNNTSTLSRHELPGQCTLDSKGVNAIDKATDANGDLSKDSDHTIDAEITTDDEPDPTLASVKVNKVGEANDANGHPSQESDVQLVWRIATLIKPDIIHDSSKTIDANAEPTESMVDDDVEHNDVSQSIIQGSQKETVSDDVEMEIAYETTDATGHVNKDCDDRIDDKNTIIDQGKDLSIQDSVETNDATPMEGGSVIIGEQNIVQNGLTDFNNHEDQASNHEELK
jgi:hypothetical protein